MLESEDLIKIRRILSEYRVENGFELTHEACSMSSSATESDSPGLADNRGKKLL
jgi:hypothetical protein